MARACDMCGERIEGPPGKRGPPKTMHKECRTAYNDLTRLERAVNQAMLTRSTQEGRRHVAETIRARLQSIRNSDLTPVIRGARKGKADPRKRKRAPVRRAK